MIPEQAFFDFFKPLILKAWALSGSTDTPTLALWKPNAPEPLSPAFVLRITLSNMPDNPELSEVDENGVQTVSDQAEAAITITGIGNGTYAALLDVQSATRTPTAGQKASALNLGMVDRPRVTDVSALINSIQYEERATLDTRMRFTNVVSDNVGVIETVNVSGDYSGGLADDLQQSFTLNVATP